MTDFLSVDVCASLACVSRGIPVEVLQDHGMRNVEWTLNVSLESSHKETSVMFKFNVKCLTQTHQNSPIPKRVHCLHSWSLAHTLPVHFFCWHITTYHCFLPHNTNQQNSMKPMARMPHRMRSRITKTNKTFCFVFTPHS